MKTMYKNKEHISEQQVKLKASMNSDNDKFITEVMLEGMLCVQKIVSLCETAAVMLSFVPISTREMCAFYNKASRLFLHGARSERKADRWKAEMQHSHGGGYMTGGAVMPSAHDRRSGERGIGGYM